MVHNEYEIQKNGIKFHTFCSWIFCPEFYAVSWILNFFLPKSFKRGGGMILKNNPHDGNVKFQGLLHDQGLVFVINWKMLIITGILHHMLPTIMQCYSATFNYAHNFLSSESFVSYQREDLHEIKPLNILITQPGQRDTAQFSYKLNILANISSDSLHLGISENILRVSCDVWWGWCRISLCQFKNNLTPTISGWSDNNWDES